MRAERTGASGLDPFERSRRVLHVAQPADGGVPRYVRDLVAGQVAGGWDVHVAGPPEAAGPAGTPHPWRAHRSPAKGVRAEQGVLREIIGRVDPEVVVLHSSKAGLVGRLVVRGSRPTVFVPHAWSYLALPPGARTAAVAWERAAARWTSAVLAVSGAEAESGVRAGIDAPMFVVTNPGPGGWAVAGDDDRRRAREDLGLPAGPVVVCVGRICRQKGQDALVRAWPDVRRACPDATLVIVGGGELPDSPVPPGVVLAGPIGDPRPHLAAADVVAVPSRWEGCSLAMLEALAVGRCVVSTRVFGSEVVEAADAGAVVPVDDPAAMAAALVARLGDPDRAAAEGRRGAAHVARHHRLDDVVSDVSAVIARAYAFGRPARRSPLTWRSGAAARPVGVAGS